jgi:L-aminopeptidase/D-esterase-like protein
LEAIENSTGGKIAEGNVGGGTGMMCLVLKAAQELLREFLKSRIQHILLEQLYNQFWSKRDFTVAGVPVGMNLGYPKLYHPCSTNLKKTRRWLY